MRNRLFVRRLGSANLLEAFLVLSIGTVLGIRAVLALTNYPQLGGNGLHIAHMLWGGLAMLVALILLISSINGFARAASAVIGGVGFGFFIDEVGKFVTSDNNYFFRPAVSIMYIVFVLLYVAIRAIDSRPRASHRTYLANAMELAMEGMLRPVDEEERKRRREVLACCDQQDPKVALVTQLMDHLDVVPAGKRGWVSRLAEAVSHAYARLVRRSWYSRLVVLIFAVAVSADLIEAGTVIGPMAMLPISLVVALVLVLFCLWIARRRRPLWQRVLAIAGVALAGSTILAYAIWVSRRPELLQLKVASLIQLLATVAGGILGVIGVWRLRRSRLAAYRMFMKAVLVSLLVGQVFAFYEQQFWALLGLLASIFMWVTLRLLIHEEHGMLDTKLETESEPASPRPASGSTAAGACPELTA